MQQYRHQSLSETRDSRQPRHGPVIQPLMTKPSNEDIELFHRSVGEVKPVTNDRIMRRKQPASPRARFREMDEARVIEDMLSDQFDPAELETGEELVYVRPGLQHRTMKKLRRGAYVVNAELDLHGMTVPIARQAVAEFLNGCRQRRFQCVRIIHGKGRGSRHRGPILKRKLGGWLRQRNEILAYCSARLCDGGTGAVYVLLSRRQQ